MDDAAAGAAGNKSRPPTPVATHTTHATTRNRKLTPSRYRRTTPTSWRHHTGATARTVTLRNALGSLPLWAGVVDVVILFALAAVVMRIAVRVFTYGSIAYGNKVSLKAALGRRTGDGTRA